MLVFAFRSEIWIGQNFNFTVFEDFCLSLSWKYRFLQNVNHAKVQSKTNKYCKFHVDLTRRRLSKSRFKKLGMVPKKLYRNTLNWQKLTSETNITLYLQVPFRVVKLPLWTGWEGNRRTVSKNSLQPISTLRMLLQVFIFHLVKFVPSWQAAYRFITSVF